MVNLHQDLSSNAREFYSYRFRYQIIIELNVVMFKEFILSFWQHFLASIIMIFQLLAFFIHFD